MGQHDDSRRSSSSKTADRDRDSSSSRKRKGGGSSSDDDRGGRGGGDSAAAAKAEAKRRKREEKEKKKKEKALRKLLETPEEKRQRRLEKKARKAQRRREKEEEERSGMAGYTNEANPFGDANLTDRFVWKLKRERAIANGADPRELDDVRTERLLREERLRELEKAKKRRLEREREREQWEAERERMARERDGLSYEDWERQEQQFNLEQAQRRSEIRIREGRPKPIDILYKNLNMADERAEVEFDIELNEPYKIFADLTLPELEELRKDILMYLQLDSHKEFWQSLRIVCDDEIAQLHKQRDGGGTGHGLEASGMHKSVSEEVVTVLRGKTYDELHRMQQQVMAKVTAANAVDPEYWEALLARLVVFKAKAKLREIHADLLRRKLAQLEASQMLEEARRTVEDQQAAEQEEGQTMQEEGSVDTAGPDKDASSGGWDDEKVEKAERAGDDDECLSPELVNDIDTDEIIDPELDKQQLEEERKRILEREAKKEQSTIALAFPSTNLSEAQLYQMEADTDMGEDEEAFSSEVALESKKYWWQDKYRPRKPRYYNRVHTGYEWNKYNQSHYDHDNPPPKTVQGYKFNIFYPDLIDKAKAPRYFIEPSDSSETCIIRFHAGPPYEDVAFKIVNREWEYSHKRGFKCVFDRGIMHLWFNFKRYRYRR